MTTERDLFYSIAGRVFHGLSSAQREVLMLMELHRADTGQEVFAAADLCPDTTDKKKLSFTERSLQALANAGFLVRGTREDVVRYWLTPETSLVCTAGIGMHQIDWLREAGKVFKK